MRTPTLELVVAAAENGVIGRDNSLPWRLPADLRRFKAITLGKPVLMGRSTHESIGRALPGRINYVLSRRTDYTATGCEVVPSLEEAQARAGNCAVIMVIGGAEVYRLCLPVAERIHLTLVHAQIVGDTVFEGWRGAEWHESQRIYHEADAQHEWPFSFITLSRAPSR